MDAVLDNAMRRECELLRAMSEQQALITNLRRESGIAKEAIDRFCPPELQEIARRWLRGYLQP